MKNLKNKSPQFSLPYRLFFKSLLVPLALAAVSISAHALEPNAVNWKLNTSVNNVDFYHAITVCNGKTVVLLKFVNKNNYAVNVSFKEAFKTPVATEQAPYAGKIKLTVQPGETLAQSCSDNTCKECLILPERVFPSHRVDVQQFDFKEIDVKQ